MNGKKEGQGILVHKNGQVEEGFWNQDVLIQNQRVAVLLEEKSMLPYKATIM